MGDLTFAQMQTLVKRTVSNRTDLDTEIAQAINDAQLFVASQRGLIPTLDKGPKSFSTVVNASYYALSTAVFTTVDEARIVLGIHSPMYDSTSGRKLRIASMEEIVKADVTTAGAPRAFAHWYDGIKIYPKSDAVYTLNFTYRVRPLLLSASADVSVLPAELDWAIVWSAAADINASIGALDKGAFYTTKRNDVLGNIVTFRELEDETADISLAPSLT